MHKRRDYILKQARQILIAQYYTSLCVNITIKNSLMNMLLSKLLNGNLGNFYR